MAGMIRHSKKSSRQNDRLGPGIGHNSSRVSKVVGGIGSTERTSGAAFQCSTVKQSSRGQNLPRSATQGGKPRAKKGSSPRLTDLLIRISSCMWHSGLTRYR